MANNGTSCNGTSKESAWVFKANYLDNGTVYFTTQNGTLYLAMDVNNYNIYAATELVNAATWGIRCVEQNNTAVDEVLDEQKSESIYDLTGRKVETPNKGVYIINGKKVLVK